LSALRLGGEARDRHLAMNLLLLLALAVPLSCLALLSLLALLGVIENTLLINTSDGAMYWASSLARIA
jgi:hypothetical protein